MYVSFMYSLHMYSYIFIYVFVYEIYVMLNDICIAHLVECSSGSGEMWLKETARISN